jgi:hypothetical protein
MVLVPQLETLTTLQQFRQSQDQMLAQLRQAFRAVVIKKKEARVKILATIPQIIL